MLKALVVLRQDQNYSARSKLILCEISAEFKTSLEIHKLLPTLCKISDFSNNIDMVRSDSDKGKILAWQAGIAPNFSADCAVGLLPSSAHIQVYLKFHVK